MAELIGLAVVINDAGSVGIGRPVWTFHTLCLLGDGPSAGPAQEFATAVWTDGAHDLGAVLAECALITADIGLVLGSQIGPALLA